MTRLLLSIFCSAFMGTFSLTTLAADSTSADQNIRAQVDAKRERISGVDKIVPTSSQGPSAVLDLPVDTGDAPAQVHKP
jgi:hypothetical protein